MARPSDAEIRARLERAQVEAERTCSDKYQHEEHIIASTTIDVLEWVLGEAEEIGILPEEWGASLKPPISSRRARVLCEEGRVDGAYREGEGRRATWRIPAGAPDPRKWTLG